MITEVHKKGTRVGGLLRYLYGPGRAEEHINPRLVGAWDDSGPLSDLEPEVTATGARDFRHLVAMLQEPVQAADRKPPRPVWHASMRLAPEDRDRTISDATWGHMAREMLAEAGIARHGDDAGLRFVVVRHNDDHVHIVATLVREDGRIDWMKNDWARTREATARISTRFGLHHRPVPADRTAGKRSTQQETFRARRLHQPQTNREELRGHVRTAVAASASPQEFFDRLRSAGTMVKLREDARQPGAITGYAVATPPRPGKPPIFYSGGKLAADLSLPKLRQRWGTPPPSGSRHRVTVSRAERIRAMHQASTTAHQAVQDMRRNARTDPAAAQATAEAAADTLRAVAAAVEGRRRGPITAAADAFDRAARAGTGHPTARHTTQSTRMRSMSRLVSLMGRVSGDDDALAALRLVLKLATLADTLGHLRDAQQRLHQAQAARNAAAALRAVAASAAPTAPSTRTTQTFHGGRAQTHRPPRTSRTGGRR